MKLKTMKLEQKRRADLDQELLGLLVDFPQALLLLLPHVKHLLFGDSERKDSSEPAFKNYDVHEAASTHLGLFEHHVPVGP